MRSLPCQREVPSASEAEGLPAVCGCNGQSGKARRNPPGRWRGQPPLTRGPFLRGQSPREEPPLTGEVAAKQAGGAFAVCGGGRLRRGQDPSLRCKRQKGATGKAAGRACPAPTDCCENLRTRGAREGGSPPLFPLTGCRGRLRAAYMPPLQSSRSPLRGFGGTPDSKVEEGAGALRTKSNTAFV